MLRFEGDHDLAHPLADVTAKLGDARFLVTCIPDRESVSLAEPTRAECVIRPGFAFVRGTLDMALTVLETNPAIRVQLTTRGIGSTSEVEATLQPTAQDARTRVHWVAEVKTLGGLLKAVPQGLVRGAAEKVVRDAWGRIAERLKEEGAP
jgi:carbon monoxide dehydrogenase subunit G